MEGLASAEVGDDVFGDDPTVHTQSQALLGVAFGVGKRPIRL